tara:strand:- start:14387 stop:14722 length:336 start_codon:yes stop_codon:yes gene_type:complete
MDKYKKAEQAIILVAFARVNVFALAIALAISFALITFFATIALVLQDFTLTVSSFMPGYTITFWGAGVGALYFGLLGLILGFFLSLFWNLTHVVYITMVVIRANWWRMMAE